MTFIAAQDEPVGSQRLKEALEEAGISVAEATAGRFLRSLDGKGYTQSIGATRGRVLTPRGQERLAKLLRERRLASLSADLVEAIDISDLSSLLDLLYVRLAVEPAAARLVALRASDEEIAAIAQLAERHVHCVGDGGDTVEPSRAYHQLLAESSGNGVLTAVATYLLDPLDDRLARLLDRISFEAGEALEFARDHQRVSRCLQARDASGAASAMRDHLEKLMDMVARYVAGSTPREPETPVSTALPAAAEAD
ncbi:MAG: FCD domain-containing protein [Thermomicrobiales bacterium]|nr:FCD domain-containing protein [Thermomicrobiales bacterium]